MAIFWSFRRHLDNCLRAQSIVTFNSYHPQNAFFKQELIADITEVTMLKPDKNWSEVKTVRRPRTHHILTISTSDKNCLPSFFFIRASFFPNEIERARRKITEILRHFESLIFLLPWFSSEKERWFHLVLFLTKPEVERHLTLLANNVTFCNRLSSFQTLI